MQSLWIYLSFSLFHFVFQRYPAPVPQAKEEKHWLETVLVKILSEVAKSNVTALVTTDANVNTDFVLHLLLTGQSSSILIDNY